MKILSVIMGVFSLGAVAQASDVKDEFREIMEGVSRAFEQPDGVEVPVTETGYYSKRAAPGAVASGETFVDEKGLTWEKVLKGKSKDD